MGRAELKSSGRDKVINVKMPNSVTLRDLRMFADIQNCELKREDGSILFVRRDELPNNIARFLPRGHVSLIRPDGAA